MNILQLAGQVIPSGVRARLKGLIPRAFKINASIAQVFVNDHDKETRYTLTNFPSFFSPIGSSSYVYQVKLIDSDGDLVGQRNLKIEKFGSFELRPKEIFGTNIPEFGMVLVELRQPKLLFYADRHLGNLNSHFYSFYYSHRTGSMALVHPQTSSDAKPSKGLIWKSNLFIPSENLSSLELYQLNPSQNTAETKLSLCDEDRNVLFESHAIMKAQSTRKIVWDCESIQSSGYLHIECKGMTAPNAKPLVFRHMKNGTFNASHS